MYIVLRVMRLTYTRGLIGLSNCAGLSQLVPLPMVEEHNIDPDQLGSDCNWSFSSSYSETESSCFHFYYRVSLHILVPLFIQGLLLNSGYQPTLRLGLYSG